MVSHPRFRPAVGDDGELIDLTPVAAQRPAGRELRRGLGRRPRTLRARRPPRRDLARGLSVRRADAAPGVRDRQAAAADRAAEAAGLGQGHRAEARRRLRGPGRRRQGRHDQAVHRAPEPARRPRGGAGQAVGARAHPVVLPALRPAPARGRGDRAVRPVLVQPRRRRAGDGLLHRRRSTSSSCGRRRSSSGCWSTAASTWSSSTSRCPAASSGRRFIVRQIDPVRQWKLSPTDLASLDKWDDYTEAKEAMFLHTDTARRAVDGDQEQRQEAGPAGGDAARAVPAGLRRQGAGRGRRPRPADRRLGGRRARGRRRATSGQPGQA